MAPLRIFRHYVAAQTVLLLAGDLLLFLSCLFLGVWLKVLGGPGLWMGDPPYAPKIVLFVGIALITFSAAGLYDQHQPTRLPLLVARHVAAAVVWGILYSAMAFAVPSLRLGRLVTAETVVLGTALAFAFRYLLIVHPTGGRFRKRLLFLGATPTAERLISTLESEPSSYEILGYVDDRPEHEVALTNGFRVLGGSRQLKEIALATGAGTIVVALTERRGAFPMSAILDCKLRGIQVEDWPTFYEKLTGKIVVQDLRPSWLVFSEGFDRTQTTRTLKRWLDVMMSAGFLALGWPVFLLVGFAIRLDSPGPILFRQERIGEGGKPFTVFKFRTMVQNAESVTGPVWATEEDPRITRLGRILRKTRLDELPQVFNVLRGEMSFVGPRPERPHFVAQLQERIPYYSQRHTVKPGITGWAQVRYRYGATVEDAEEKLMYDLYYIKNLSLFLDLVVLAASVKVVLCGKGAR
jgi:sugar transferase (PEP-CTERM system associated)